MTQFSLPLLLGVGLSLALTPISRRLALWVGAIDKPGARRIHTVATPRFAFALVGLFAGLAILLAAIGTYGVISYSVTQRTPEFGLRMALGAQRFDVLRLVLIQATKLVLLGTGTGVALALVLARALKSLIYEVSPTDPMTFTAIGFSVIAVAIFACYIPARKATEADPMIALRAE